MTLPTASKLQLAARCVGSVVLPGAATDMQSGRDGHARHAALAARIAGEAHEATPDVAEWLAGLEDDALAPLAGADDEVTLAWCHETGAARIVGRRLERRYSVGPAEYVGTADYLRLEAGRVVVADLKTGMADVEAPARNAQLRFLAMAAARAHGVDAARVGILRAPPGRQPWWQWADVDAFELEAVAVELRTLAQRIDEAGDEPPLTTGEHCQWCPARHRCPARVGMARAMAEAPMAYGAALVAGLEDDATAAQTLARWQAARKVLDEVGAALHARASERPIPLGDGQQWGPVASTRETIDAEAAWPVLAGLLGADGARAAMTLETSKAGLERAVKAAKASGTLAGTIKAGVGQALEALRAAGAVVVKTRTEYASHAAPAPMVGAGGDAAGAGE